MRVWGVRRQNGSDYSIPCLFGSRENAEENRDPDEDLVLVRVEILSTVQRNPTRKAARTCS